MEDLGPVSTFTTKELFAVEQIYIDWNFQTNKELCLNRHTKAGGGKVIISSRVGRNNPMYGKPKSPEFIYWQTKDMTRHNNPMWGVEKAEETLAKTRKKVFVFDAETKKLIQEFKGTVECKKTLKMSTDTLYKYIESGKPYKGKILSRFPTL